MLLSQIIDELNKGERTPEDILASLRPPGERDALMRCATVRCFDRELAEAALLPEGGPSFDELVARADVEPVPRAGGLFRLRTSARSAHWREWWTQDTSTAPNALPSELRRLLMRLVDYYASPERPIDLLALTALVDPDRAVSRFQDLYRQADEAFNLPDCQDLVDVLSDPDRISLLTPRLNELLIHHQAYLRARGLWSAEWFNTTNFLEQEGVAGAYQALLEPRGSRALNLHAQGGRGKSIQLRWLIARRLVPTAELQGMAGGQVPCAKVDFDFIDPVNATRYPWIVLLKLAAQLNDQLPKPPFSGMLEDNGWAIPLLDRNPPDAERFNAASKRVQSQGARVGREVTTKFGRILAEHVDDRAVVFVFDTLEEIHLRPQGDLLSLIKLVGGLLDTVPGLRLVLAGRYPIREILARAGDALPDLTELTVKPFSDPEAEGYLSRLRLIDAPATRQAIADKAAGDPFLLSLLADIVQTRPRLSPADIGRYPADVIRLIVRVIERIQQPGVRWLLRYGVVPRRLTLGFVRDVMQPYLRDAMSGELTHDAPEQDELPAQLEGSEKNFRTDLMESSDSPLDIEALWQELRSYAGSTSWVYEVPGSPDTLRFRADIVNPMRAIIRPHSVYRQLHGAAIGYYEAKAAAEPERWETSMREAIYHRFQLEGVAAVPYWRSVLDAAGEWSPARREAIATELLEPDYIDEHGDPLPAVEEQPIVDRETLVAARFARCLALVGLARLRGVAPDDQLWSQAEKEFSRAGEAERTFGVRVIGAAGRAYVRGAFALKAGRLQAAEATARDALPGAGAGAETVRLELLMGDAQLARGGRDAADTYLRALRAAPSTEWEPPIRERIVLAEAEVDALDDAHAAYQAALAAARSSSERAALQVLGAGIELRCGYATRAEQTAQRANSDAWTFAWRLLVAAANAQQDPGRAIEIARRAYALVGPTMNSGAASTAEAADACEAVGIAASVLMEQAEASTALDPARSLWQSMGDLAAVARCSAVSTTLEMRQVGDLNVAAQHLREAESVELVKGADDWLEGRLLRAELLSRRAETAAAASSAAQTLEELRQLAAPPRRMVRAGVAALAHGEPHTFPGVLDEILRQCALVTPTSARLVVLSGLKDVKEIPPAARSRLGALRDLAGLQPDPQLSGIDRAVLQMTIAEMERLAGDTDTALGQLADARRVFEKGSTSFWLRGWSQAHDRLGTDHPPVSRSEIRRFMDEMSTHPMLCAAFLVERAEAGIAAGSTDSLELLEAAERCLAEIPGRNTQWDVRLQRAKAATAVGDTAADLLRTAGAAARGLGWPVWWRNPESLERPATGADHDPMGELARRRARVRLSRAANDSLEVNAILPGPPRIELHESIAVPFLTEHGRRLAEGMADWWMQDRFSGEHRFDDLLGSTLEAAPAADALELRVETRDHVLHAFPWEFRSDRHTGLAAEPGIAGVIRVLDADAAGRDETTFVQAALARLTNTPVLVDADFGPRLRESLRGYQRGAGLAADGVIRDAVLEHLQRDLAAFAQAQADSARADRRPVVVLVQPSTERQVYAVRGKASLGVDIERSYEYAGFRVLRPANPEIPMLRSTVERAIAGGDVPCVLHISGGLRELGGGLALTFLAGEWSQEAQSGLRTSDEFSVTGVDFVLDAFRPGTFRPLVILDIDSPHGPTESAAQLFMRNAFAADLFALGHCPAIIATGLTTGAVHELYDNLVGALGAGRSVLELASILQNIPSAGDQDIGPAATALFTHLPWLRPRPL